MTGSKIIHRLDSRTDDFQANLQSLLKRDSIAPDQMHVQQQVQAIIHAVRQRGDAALREYTQQFDGIDLGAEMQIPQQDLLAALESISSAERAALEFAAEQIRNYHERQQQHSWTYQTDNGSTLGQKVTPLQRVGLYVPGGKAAYPSSVLMNALPAKVAGVAELVMVTPTPRGETNPLVLAAAAIAGVDQVFRIGGAQAIAALAYGTQSIQPVDKITGPGNAYVAAAKQQVFGQVGIDMIAGPSEVLIIADSNTNPDWVAMDLFAQAEHDELAQSILLSTDSEFLTAVDQAIESLLPTMERQDIIRTSLANNGALIAVQNDKELVAIANMIAAEHLEIFTANAPELALLIDNAGAIFIGPYSAESLGDYCAGPNHVLPTSGTARFSSPLGVYDFQKRSSIIQITAEDADMMGQQASILARGESLTGHARSAEYRLKRNRN